MTTTRACRALTIMALLSFATLAVAGCSGSSAEVGSSDQAVSAGTNPANAGSPSLSDDELAKALGGDLSAQPPKPSKAPATITAAQANALINATVNPVATTKRLTLLNQFIADGVENSQDDQYQAMALQMEGLVLGTPKDIVSVPAGLGGQTIRTSEVLDESSIGPTKIKIVGVAAADYKLTFKIGGSTLNIDRVPAGSTAAQTAKLIGAKIKASAHAIAGSMGSRTDGFKDIGGDHSGSPSGVDDVEVTVDGDTVEIVVALNG